MDISGVNNNLASILALQSKAKAVRPIDPVESRASQIRPLQQETFQSIKLKVEESRQQESGFQNRLDSRTAVALTAANAQDNNNPITQAKEKAQALANLNPSLQIYTSRGSNINIET